VVGEDRGDGLGGGGAAVGAHSNRGAEADGVLGVGVYGDGPTQLDPHHLGHQRDPGRSADQQDRADVLGRDLGRADGAAQGDDGLRDRRADHGLELGPGQPYLGLEAGDQHRDRDVRVRGQSLLGVDALLAQPGHRSLGRGLLGIEAIQAVAHRRPDVGEDRLVEVDAAEPLDAFGRADDLEAVVVGAAHGGGVEGAAAQVVHGDDRARLQPALRGVERGRGHRLGDQQGGVQVDLADGLGEQIELVVAPVGRVGQRDGPRGLALLLAHPVDGPPQHAGHQHLGRVRGAAEDDGRRIADPPLELAGHAARIGRRPAGGGLAHQDLAVVPQEDDRRHGGRPVAQGQRLHDPTAFRCRCGVGRAEVDAEVVCHALLLGRGQLRGPGRSPRGLPPPTGR
jgi:hypothetical protein